MKKSLKGQNVLEPGLPESFRVLMKELKSLGLDMNLIEENSKEKTLGNCIRFLCKTD